ncbi:MAG: hypothetical protein Q9190_005593 [Brigantiaea leucoxantha]
MQSTAPLSHGDEAPPPPYSPQDGHSAPTSPLTPDTTSLPFRPSLRGGYARPADLDPLVSSAGAYFEERPCTIHSPSAILEHHLVIPGETTGHVFQFPHPRNQYRDRDITNFDWNTFNNFLFPIHTDRNSAKAGDHRQRSASPKDALDRQARIEDVVAEWNEKFFGPRGVRISAVFPSIAYTSASPPPPFVSVPELVPLPELAPATDLNSSTPYGITASQQRIQRSQTDGFIVPNRARDIAGQALSQGLWSRLLGNSRGDHGEGKQDFRSRRDRHRHRFVEHSHAHHLRGRQRSPSSSSSSSSSDDHHRHRRWGHRRRSSSCSSSSSSSSSDSGYGGRPRGFGRRRRRFDGRGRGKHHHGHGRHRSPSTSSSSSSSSNSSIDSISTSDISGMDIGRLHNIIDTFRHDPLRKANLRLAVRSLKNELHHNQRLRGSERKEVGREIKAQIRTQKKVVKAEIKSLIREGKAARKIDRKNRKAERKNQRVERKAERRMANGTTWSRRHEGRVEAKALAAEIRSQDQLTKAKEKEMEAAEHARLQEARARAKAIEAQEQAKEMAAGAKNIAERAVKVNWKRGVTGGIIPPGSLCGGNKLV